jgi:hypothetical protein
MNTNDVNAKIRQQIPNLVKRCQMNARYLRLAIQATLQQHELSKDIVDYTIELTESKIRVPPHDKNNVAIKFDVDIDLIYQENISKHIFFRVVDCNDRQYITFDNGEYHIITPQGPDDPLNMPDSHVMASSTGTYDQEYECKFKDDDDQAFDQAMKCVK